MAIERRKDDHIRIALAEDVSSTHNHWDDVVIHGRALPEIDIENIDLRTEFMGKGLKAPILIASMTGGSPQAKKYNELLAKAAAEYGIGFGIGSQRAGLEKEEHIASYSVVKDHDIPLVLANLGLPQFSDRSIGGSYGKKDIHKAMDMIGADGICIHLNYLQEVVQPEGDCMISGALKNLSDVCGSFDVVAKETGGGISLDDAMVLKDIGVKAIDVGGVSGTTFSGVESFRHDDSGRSRRLGQTFWDWGIPTPVSLVKLRGIGLPLVGTGGIRNGLDAAKAMALGADIAGIAWKFLKAASSGYNDLTNEIKMIEEEMRSVIFLSGLKNAGELSTLEPLLIGKTAELVRQ